MVGWGKRIQVLAMIELKNVRPYTLESNKNYGFFDRTSVANYVLRGRLFIESAILFANDSIALARRAL
jgi:hypothetical protein